MQVSHELTVTLYQKNQSHETVKEQPVFKTSITS